MAPAHTIKTLELTIGYNKSDATFGWKGFDNALTLYYLRTRFKNILMKPYYMTHKNGPYNIVNIDFQIRKSSDEEFVSPEHSYPLVDGLSPSVSRVFQ